MSVLVTDSGAQDARFPGSLLRHRGDGLIESGGAGGAATGSIFAIT